MSFLMIGRWKNQDRREQAEGHDRVAPKVIELARSLGNTHHRVYHAAETNEGFVIDEWESAEGIQRFYGSDEFQNALREGGFSPPDEVIVLEELEGDPNTRY